MLEDGSYDIFVVDAEEVDADSEAGDTVRLELTILAGEHKGEMVTVTATGLAADAIDLLGTPGTLTVAGGEPTVSLEG